MTAASGAVPASDGPPVVPVTDPSDAPVAVPAAEVSEEAAPGAARCPHGGPDAAPEERLLRIVALARVLFDVPMAAIALIDADSQWIKAAAGLDHGLSVPRRYSPCHYTVQQPGPLVLEDTARVPRVSDTTVVREGVRFYAGQPLRAPTGERVGSLCIMDTAPRAFTVAQQELLADLGQLVEHELAVTGELAEAGAAQRALLPAAGAHLPGYEAAGRCTPARRAAGSWFDWRAADGLVQLEVADVLGAGAGHAAIADWLHALLRATGPAPAADRPVVRTAGSVATTARGAGAFVTAFVATLDTSSGDLTYVMAGYGAAVVLGVDGTVRRLTGSGPALGLSSAYGAGWDVRTAALRPGDTLLVLTDGFLDLDPDPDALLDRGLGTVARRYPDGIGADEAVDLATAWAVTEGHPIDITVLALHRVPEQGASRCPGTA